MKRQRTALRPLDMTLAAMFVALMAIGANITSWVPFLVVGGVPITLQTFFCVLAGAVLGRRLGAVAMIVYMLVGLAGVPVFAKLSGGLSIIFQPTFGFILSFIVAAYATGWLINRGPQPASTARFVTAALVGMILNYVIGTNWMYMAYKLWAEAPQGLSYGMVWGWMLAPLPKDIVLSIVAGVIAPKLCRAIQRSSAAGRPAA
ncbi:biotin biosynthesis protein BioC [Geobacillus genomosp. 3]|uniref:Biotin transporter n=1 Tax=Geobacillus genomosp. 3 TaxID=1921421 RepID=S5Z8Y8_GEOG3|nr:biotin transporter BioY [Geobacillus genomosp. 3]AGT33282.1 biotin biosynthesis protein BioC [Geobacillus genomosp. 3]